MARSGRGVRQRACACVWRRAEMKREMVCICCPLGCLMQVEKTEEGVSVSGNTCPRGSRYAEQELVCPMRVLTSTVALTRPTASGIARVPVKTLREIPKEKIFEVMAELQQLSAELPVRCGQVLLEDCAGTGVPVVATRSLE